MVSKHKRLKRWRKGLKLHEQAMTKVTLSQPRAVLSCLFRFGAVKTLARVYFKTDPL